MDFMEKQKMKELARTLPGIRSVLLLQRSRKLNRELCAGIIRCWCLFVLMVSAILANGQDLKSGGVLKPEQAIMDVRHYAVSVAVDPALQRIDGTTEITFVLSQPTSTLLFDLVSLLKVNK